MDLSEERLRQALGTREFRYLPDALSTQDIAKQWLPDAPSGAVVVADSQRGGRGRGTRTWVTPQGQAVAVSVILRPDVSAPGQVTMLGCLAAAEVLDDLGVPGVTIKWPNDVQIHERKVCGVLPEAVWFGNRLQGVILGIGLNVRVDFAGTELEATAISVEPALGRSVDRTELIRQMMERIDHWAARLGSPALFDVWRARLVTIGREVTINGVNGVAEDVDADGALLVRDGSGTLHRMLAGDVEPGT